jgi:hypothetical protein
MRAALLALLILSGVCAAQEPKHDVRLGAGADVLHQRGKAVVALTADSFTLLAWNNANFGAGVSYRLGRPTGLSGSIGGIVVHHTDEDVGTHLNVLLRASYCGEKLCLSYAHISHASFLFAADAANSGLNFVFLEYRFR